MRNRIKYSQNFLKDSDLVRALITKSGISTNDIVCEIGAGEGIITSELLKVAKKVIAFEVDQKLFNGLRRGLGNETKLELKPGDFLDFPLPNYPYKVFSNIPFNITAQVIKKLTSASNPPLDSHLIVQKEAAEKFVGGTLMAVLLYPRFELKIIHRFNKRDFSPTPNVDIVLLNIKKREKALIDDNLKNEFQDFVAYNFNKPSVKIPKPSQLSNADWLRYFEPSQKTVGAYSKMLMEQESLEKIHRTRVDKNWRKALDI